MQNRIKVRRVELNMTQADIAEKTGICRQTISNIERGNSIPSLTNAIKIACVLNCKLEDVFKIH